MNEFIVLAAFIVSIYTVQFLQDFSMLIMVQRVEILTSNSFDIQTESAINFTKVGTFVQKYFIGELVADNVQFLT